MAMATFVTAEYTAGPREVAVYVLPVRLTVGVPVSRTAYPPLKLLPVPDIEPATLIHGYEKPLPLAVQFVNTDVAAAPIITGFGLLANPRFTKFVPVAEKVPFVQLNMLDGTFAGVVKLPPVTTILPPPVLVTAARRVTEGFVPVHSFRVTVPVPVFATALAPETLPAAISARI